MLKNVSTSFSLWRKCIFCKSRHVNIDYDSRVRCNDCKKRYSLKKVKKDLRIIEMFSLEISARKASKHLKLSYNNVKSVYDKIRNLIYMRQMEKERIMRWMIELDESYFWWRRKWNRWRWSDNKSIVFWILERSNDIYVTVVDSVSSETLMGEIAEKTEKWSVYYSDNWKSYNSLKHYWKHYKVNHSKTFVNWKNKNIHTNGIEWFWSYAKERFAKYHWVSKNKFIYYLKELEFRYNNRNANIHKILASIFYS